MPGLLYAEDLPVGDTMELGSLSVSHQDIVEFAARWDPQSFHVDDEAAAAGRFGEVVGSGLHTMCLFQRLAVLGAYRHWAIVAGRTIRDVQLTSPLRPGMTVHASLLVLHVELTHPERALVVKRGAVRSGPTTLLSMELEAYVQRRVSTP